MLRCSKNEKDKAMARYKNYNDGQHYFGIIDLEKELPADNRARIIKEIISNIDVSEFDANYNNKEFTKRLQNIEKRRAVLEDFQKLLEKEDDATHKVSEKRYENG